MRARLERRSGEAFGAARSRREEEGPGVREPWREAGTEKGGGGWEEQSEGDEKKKQKFYRTSAIFSKSSQ